MKLTKTFAFLVLASVCCATALATETAPLRGKLDLDGEWNFAVDSQNVGETEKWFDASYALTTEVPEGYAPKKPGKIDVPGIWDAQGYGTPTAKVKHNAVGKAWYKRTVEIPQDWNPENSLYFVITGVSRYAKVWINGQLIGDEAIGCVGSHEWNVSSFVKPGEVANIAICVDSDQRWDVDPLLGAASLNDYLEIEWGGIWGHVYLESRPKTRLDSLYLRTKLEYSPNALPYKNFAHIRRCLAEAKIVDENKSPELSGLLRFELFDKTGSRLVEEIKNFEKLDLSSGEQTIEIVANLHNVELWSPDEPNLYDVRVTVMFDGNSQRDAIQTRYGPREIKFDGVRVLLNGNPFFLRGYGDDHIYPIEFSMPTDINMYRERLKLIKSFGFNHCRHHSCILPHEYYDACDEIGMFPNAEMLVGYPQQLPGEGDLWKRNVPEGTDPKPALDTLKERWATVVKEFRNHPSIFIWVGGNELCMLGWERWRAMPLGREFKEIANSLDPDRYFTDCDGDWLHDYNNRGGRTDVQDFYSILFDEWSNPVLNRHKFDTPVKLDRPTVSHEAGNFLTFSRQDQVELFKNSNYKPFWMEEGKAKLEELGLANEVEDWARASEQLYLLAHKYNVEGVRLNEDLSGYHWWLIQDYWTTSNGIFDLFFRPKSLKPEDILPFNSAVVTLQKGLEFSYRSGEEFSFVPVLSNFSDSFVAGKMSVKIEASDEKSLPKIFGSKGDFFLASGKLGECNPFKGEVPAVERPVRWTTTVAFDCRNQNNNEKYSNSNSWTSYVFPKDIAPKSTRTIYADESAIAYFPENFNVKSIAEIEGDYPTDAVYAVAWATPEIVAAVEKGAGLIHFGAQQFLSALPVRFQQTWWKAGDSEEQNNTGTFVYPNPITDDVVDHNFCGAIWAPLLDGAQKFSLETPRPRPDVIARALSSLVRVRDAAILFEFGVGKGKTIVSGLNHSAAKDAPVNAWLLAQFVDELSNDAPAKVQWDSKSLLPPTVVPEGTVLGLSRFVKYAETGAWKSYRSKNPTVPSWTCRQDKLGNDLVWKTAKVDASDSETTTFIFAGGTGFATTPKTDGFVLAFNGVDLLKFNVVETFEPGVVEWKSEDGAATLAFDVKYAEAPNDAFGVFKLTVPTSLVKPNQAQEIGVRSVGEGSRRWFGLNLYTDFSDLIQ